MRPVRSGLGATRSGGGEDERAGADGERRSHATAANLSPPPLGHGTEPAYNPERQQKA